MWIEDPAVRAVRIASTQPSAVSRSTYDNPHVCVTASHGIDDEASACAILSGILIDLGLAVFHRPQCTVGCIFHFDLRCHPDDQLPNTRLHVMLILRYIPTLYLLMSFPQLLQCYFHNYYNCTRSHTRDSFRNV